MRTKQFLTAALPLSLTKISVLFVNQQLSLAQLANQNLSMMSEWQSAPFSSWFLYPKFTTINQLAIFTNCKRSVISRSKQHQLMCHTMPLLTTVSFLPLFMLELGTIPDPFLFSATAPPACLHLCEQGKTDKKVQYNSDSMVIAKLMHLPRALL